MAARFGRSTLLAYSIRLERSIESLSRNGIPRAFQISSGSLTVSSLPSKLKRTKQKIGPLILKKHSSLRLTLSKNRRSLFGMLSKSKIYLMVKDNKLRGNNRE